MLAGASPKMEGMNWVGDNNWVDIRGYLWSTDYMLNFALDCIYTCIYQRARFMTIRWASERERKFMVCIVCLN